MHGSVNALTPPNCALTAAKMTTLRSVFHHNSKTHRNADLLTALQSLVRHRTKAVESRRCPLVPKPAPERGAMEGTRAGRRGGARGGAAPLSASLSVTKGSRGPGRTHPRRDDRDGQVAAVQQEG